MKARHECIRRVLEAKNSEELLAGYSDWACRYDKDLIKLGYVAPMVTAKTLMREVEDTDAHILDAGCGTGLVGELLATAGYGNIDALDYSNEMLEQARAKEIYDRHICADMNRALKIDDNTYDAVVCVGTFTFGHVYPEALEELVRITRPEGVVCFTVRDEAYHEHDYRPKMVELEAEGAWELLELRNEDYITGEDTFCKLASYRVL